MQPTNGMAAIKVTTEIDAPIERVWEVLSAVETWPQWVPTVQKVECFDGPALKLGARYRITQPRLRPAVWKVDELAEGTRFAWRAKAPGVEMVADHVLERIAPEVTTVQLSFEFRGWLGGLFRLLFGAIASEYVAKEAQALKARGEQPFPGSSRPLGTA